MMTLDNTSTLKKAIVQIASALLLTSGIFFAAATSADTDEPSPRIFVMAEGHADLVPDMAVLTLSVTQEAETAREALDASSAAMIKVMSAMQAEGIEQRDLQTSNFSIYPNYVRGQRQSAEQAQRRKIVGYTVRNSLTVRLRDISKVGAILDKSVTLGVNEGGNIRYSNDDPSEAIKQARTAAVHNAIAQAQTLANAAKVKIGRILEISEEFSQPRHQSIAMAEMSMARSVPVAAGENTYRVTVSMSFAIDQ